MKRLIFILFFIPFFSFGQTEYLPKIAWSTNIANSTFINTDTFTVTVTPLDLSEPGAFPLRMGNYLVDNRGLRYEIIDTTSYPTITVVDIFQEGFAPFNNKIGYVYQSAGDGNSPSLPTHTFEKLDSKALDYAYRIDNNILWKEANLYAQDSAQIQFHEDTLTWDATKSDLENYLSIQAFTDSIPTIKLIRLDSTGFRITESQIADLQDYLIDSDLTTTENTLINHSDSLGIAFDSIAIHRTDIDKNTSDIASMQAVSDVIETFTANSGQTTFTLSNSPSREYTVSQNGVILPSSAYSINTNTLSVTGGVWENDRIQINYKY